MIVIVWLVALCCVGLGTEFIRRGLRSWRHQQPFGSAPSSQRRPTLQAGAARALLVLGVFHWLLGIMMGLMLYLDATGVLNRAYQQPPIGLGILLLILIVGTVASAYVAVSIAYFNRPLFLVPPHLREQPGIISIRKKNSK